MSEFYFVAAVRFKDGNKIKLHVSEVPDDLVAVRNVIAQELKDHDPAVQSIVIATDKQLPIQLPF